jgi:hypothetical protein
MGTFLRLWESGLAVPCGFLSEMVQSISLRVREVEDSRQSIEGRMAVSLGGCRGC